MDNYFELYALPTNFHPDAGQVKAKFYELSRKYHPDRFAAADNTQKLESLTMAALNNKAYKTLSNSDATMAYVLQLNGTLVPDEPYSLPPDFLMEMMDINEAVSDFEAEPDNTQARETVIGNLNALLAEWLENAETCTTQYDNGDKSGKLLLQIKDMYFRKKYLLRIQERINKFAAR